MSYPPDGDDDRQGQIKIVKLSIHQRSGVHERLQCPRTKSICNRPRMTQYGSEVRESPMKVKYDIVADSESRYECPACPMKFDFDYGLLTHVESHPVLPCTCHLCDEFFGSVHGLVFHFLKCHQSGWF